ncbi:MAG: hypothetical protein G01um101425_161 [Candidatus Peregrinibacteria bacterium Gr01-1014_25]|nr:MAG: hypothetical protein G01um101425_161 [Candidatus Peregrinibacteria bacterium Gr01-1014_25]
MESLEFTEEKALVPPSRWLDYVRYMQTGEADAEFLNFVQQDDLCREAVELGLKKQRTALWAHYRELIGQNPRGFGDYQRVFNRISRRSGVPITMQDVTELNKAHDY